jgi:outer membrane protein OmpA-like peptidoglycan-associated protein
MLLEYIQAALCHARYQILSDDGSYYWKIPEFKGDYANDTSLEDCREELREVLEERVLVRIHRNFTVPKIDRIDLLIKEVASCLCSIQGEIAQSLEKDGKVVISGGVLFETDSATLAPNAGDLVRRIADVMKENPNLKISVVGHTDSTGDYNYNIKLSERRAKAFADALIKEGITANRLTAVGVGPQSPVATNGTVEGRAKNRRVELVVIR